MNSGSNVVLGEENVLRVMLHPTTEPARICAINFSFFVTKQVLVVTFKIIITNIGNIILAAGILPGLSLNSFSTHSL